MKNFKVIGTIVLVIAMLFVLMACTLTAQNANLTLEERELKYINEYIEENYGPGYYGVVDETIFEDRFNFLIYSENDPDIWAAAVSVSRAKNNLENS